METFVQALINTLSTGSLYALVAVGLTLVFSIMRIVNFAHGQMYMLGAFAVLYVNGIWGQNFFLGLAAAAAFVALIGIILERGFYARLQGRELPSMILGLGLLLLLEGLALMIFGEKAQYIGPPWPGTFDVVTATIPKIRILLLAAGVAFIFILFFVLQKTQAGRAMRAVAMDKDAALLQGINVSRINPMGFALGAAMAGVAGALLLPLHAVTPFIGGPMVVKAFIIVILGGMGSLSGSVAGAFVLATIESFGLVYIGQWAPLISYLLVILFLIFLPKGLLGRG